MRLIVIGFLSVLLSTAWAQKKFDKALAKADKSYNSGDYSKALKALTKYKSMVTSKLGPSNASMPGYHTRFAKYNLAYGVLTNFETSLDQAITISTMFLVRTQQTMPTPLLMLPKYTINMGITAKAGSC